MAKRRNLGLVIAKRELSLTEGEAHRRITLLLGKPRKTRGHEEYFCPYQIRGVGSENVRPIYGIDALQALQLAIRVVASELVDLNRRLGGKLRWLGEPGDFGFEKEMEWFRSDKGSRTKSP